MKSAAPPPPERPEERITLDDARLRIGTTVQLHGTADGQRHYVKLIGYMKPRTLLVTTPWADGGFLLVRNGVSYLVRLFAGKSVYAFTAAVIRSANTPYPYLHLSYPAEVMAREVRKAERVNVSIICAVLCGDGRAAEPVAATIDNLSAGGAALVASVPIGSRGDRVLLRFKLAVDGFERLLSLPATIRAVPVEGEDPGASSWGLQFGELDPQDSLLISGFVYRNLAAGAA